MLTRPQFPSKGQASHELENQGFCDLLHWSTLCSQEALPRMWMAWHILGRD